MLCMLYPNMATATLGENYTEITENVEIAGWDRPISEPCQLG